MLNSGISGFSKFFPLSFFKSSNLASSKTSLFFRTCAVEQSSRIIDSFGICFCFYFKYPVVPRINTTEGLYLSQKNNFKKLNNVYKHYSYF